MLTYSMSPVSFYTPGNITGFLLFSESTKRDSGTKWATLFSLSVRTWPTNITRPDILLFGG